MIYVCSILPVSAYPIYIGTYDMTWKYDMEEPIRDRDLLSTALESYHVTMYAGFQPNSYI